MAFTFGPRRGVFIDLGKDASEVSHDKDEVEAFERLDLLYRSLCAILYNYVPASGHPGGSISSGRIASSLLFKTAACDLGSPDREDADIVSYAAGHKAMGLYAILALRNEVARIGAPELLPEDESMQLRLEDLLGFRKSRAERSPTQKKLRTKFLDGHPSPATPSVRLATGASGLGLAASVGLAIGALDRYGASAPRVHILEGEGGLTPGRVSEAMAAAGSMRLGNIVLHIDWNQSSIDSDRVCREGGKPGDYTQWEPSELAWLHDWNLITLHEGFSFPLIFEAHARARALDNGQPTAIVYRTTKGWRYGIEGRASHGAGHKLCSEGFVRALEPFLSRYGKSIKAAGCARPCAEGGKPRLMEECFREALDLVRAALESDTKLVKAMAEKLKASKAGLEKQGRAPRPDAPDYKALLRTAKAGLRAAPRELVLEAGGEATLRGELGRVLAHYNRLSRGAIMYASADLSGSTNATLVGQDFAPGWFDAQGNPDSRLLSTGGICEDGMAGILSGLSAYGQSLGVGFSYGAFMAPLGHMAARLHAIGCQALKERSGRDYHPFILVCAHAGIKTGEDGPTHADPQSLQLYQDNFPLGAAISLVPWDPRELWFLVSAALVKKPAIITVFVTRPGERLPDRKALRLAPASASASGLYKLKAAAGKKADLSLLLQGSDVSFAFVQETMPLLHKAGIDVEVYYLASAELFAMHSPATREKIYPQSVARMAMGITGFTLPTIERWILSAEGRAASLYPFKKGLYLGSGRADAMLKEAGLDGQSQFKAIKAYLAARKRR